MSVHLQRLRLLRQQTGASTTIPPSDPRAQLEALRRALRMKAAASAPTRVPRAENRRLPGEEIAPGLHLIDRTLPWDALPETLCGAFDRREAFDPRRCVFFDTETTGLAGGTGTRAFMVGVARWQDATLQMRQWLIATLAAEAAMLRAFKDWLPSDAMLVSYNGKSYDAPLLKTRFRLLRMQEPLGVLSHVDLLHPARRAYRGRFENCRLGTIEREVLHVAREDDLPGSEAPAAWLGYLRGGDARNLHRVAEHNARDVISLAQLLLHLSRRSAFELDQGVPFSSVPCTVG